MNIRKTRVDFINRHSVKILISAIIILIFSLTFLIGNFRSDYVISEMITKLQRSEKSLPFKVNFSNLDSLPPPVARYFKHVLKNGQNEIRFAQFKQEGTLRTDSNNQKWMHFESEQFISPPTPGFVWKARIKIIPFVLHVMVLDSYIAGVGAGQVRFLSTIPINTERDNPQMNSGSLHRYLAEAAWYPTALLPQAGVKWSAIDDTRALATISDHGITVSLEIRFNAKGELTSIYTPGRWGIFNGKYKQVPWEGHFSEYIDIDGMKIPSKGEVGWYTEKTWNKVWQGKVIKAEFDSGRP